MDRSLPAGTRGILHPRTGLERFAVERIAPRPALAPFVADFWVLRWDLRGRPPHRQQVLTRPSVHVTFTSYLTSGATRARIAGVVRDEFVEEIHGEGRVIGAAFRPGGFRPFLDGPVASLTGRFAGVDEVFGAAGLALAGEVFAAASAEAGVARLEEFLAAAAPEPDPSAERAASVVARIAERPGLVRVDELAAEEGFSVRALQRLFHEYVGINPKWVIRRFRMQEAAERAASGAAVDWAALAAELGYADQAHFTRDFTAAVGTPPARYAREAGAGTIEA
ncbi:AraC family transcriptional regulator [Actinomadura sp. NAK00032]|uniref:helix-turn-helix domain-containing protein n=1 Tax=Actinomadura sp. NAK00032 TaxID=2742128 RepID=UPI0015904D00|nr:helix-turn-helix domain-containing protein [Actinomadura sp. NAK00032]QKW35747.1 AraC family transcriptional regulator [Actinomadura sp. NAK00032]